MTCQKCGRESVVDDTAPRLRNQRLAGRRYRCQKCGGIGLPSLGARRLAKRLAER
jgi:DNA-directed RNA polymerase subunit RPC12/RpoP